MSKKKHKKWTFEELQQEALKYNTKVSFVKNCPGAYGFALKNNILEQVCTHMIPQHISWTFDMVQAEALKYTRRVDFQKKSAKAYNVALRRGILDQVCQHMDKILICWTVETIQEEALKYKTRYAFHVNNAKAYAAALRRGILDQICSHMTDGNIYWTFEMLQEEALKYNTRSEFENGNESACQTARTRNIMDQICGHMKEAGSSSIAEKDLFHIIKDMYPTAKKLVDRKANILNKPYIYGFDIDVFIPELNKGIEYDGIFWHSFKAMRGSKVKRNWPDEDLHNYHQIKDDYFRSKGIELLHIKEEEWNKNKEECIQRCLEFLK